MVDHLLHRDRERGTVTLNHHSEGVTHQEHVRASLIENPGERRVVCGDHADLLADLLQLFQRVDGDLVLHGSPPVVGLCFFPPFAVLETGSPRATSSLCRQDCTHDREKAQSDLQPLYFWGVAIGMWWCVPL